MVLYGNIGVSSRVEAYLQALPPSIEGQSGDAALSRAIWVCTYGFGLDENETLEAIERIFNPRCVPPWEPSEIVSKVSGAARKAEGSPDRGHLLAGRSEGQKKAGRWSVYTPKRENGPKAVKTAKAGKSKPGIKFVFGDKPGTLWKKIFFPDGRNVEILFRWDGFQYVTDTEPKKHSTITREIVYDWSDGAGYPRHLVDRLEFPLKPGETKRRKIAIPYFWNDEFSMSRGKAIYPVCRSMRWN